MSRSPPPASKLFLEDIVRRIDRNSEDSEDDLAIVLRHWHDSDPADLPPEHRDDPLNRTLEPGEVGISLMSTGVHEIVRESDCHLVDRSMQLGDLVKRSVHDVQSGVVLESKVHVKLEHAISMAQYTSWVSGDELENATDVYIGDFVLYDDWVGQVEEIFDEAIAELTNGQLYGFAELGSRVQVGDRGPGILPESGLRMLQQTTPAVPEVLVSIKPTVLAISWLALNQMLDPEAALGKQRPKQFWTADEFKELSLFRPRSAMRVSDRVRFKNESLAEMHGVRKTRHGKSTDRNKFFESDVLAVRETRTSVRVLWQDGSISDNVPATNLIPYSNPDEYDCWPGDHVLWKGEEETRPGVVQFFNAMDRTAQVFWKTPPANVPSGTKAPSYSLVSVLELDAHGQSAISPEQPECLGVRRGDFVFIHREGTTNGLMLPRVPRIGEFSLNAHEEGWRHTMTHVGIDYAEREYSGKSHPIGWPEEGSMTDGISWRDPRSIDWFGEVTGLRNNGDVEVTLSSGSVTAVPLQRLTLLMDGRDDLLALWADEEMEMDEEESGEAPGFLASLPTLAQQALNQLFGIQPPNGHHDEHDHLEGDAGSQGSWEDYEGDEEMDVDEVSGDDEMPPLEPIRQAAGQLTSVSTEPVHHVNGSAHSKTTDSTRLAAPLVVDMPGPSSPVESPLPTTAMDMDMEQSDEGPWKRFKVLPSVPPDHAFLGKGARGQPSRQFMARLSKEYKLFSGSLPETIIVRAYEDRTDLLRSLIIGPENTPYEGAPFVIDWFLEDTFPQSPPQAHFHSWTNGNGRVNPNLYEEGKVCLSILGTWAGDKSESWSPSRSSLMQALVSIQGLVLVKEPWFCEPAFEKLRGTQEGIVNSRLYNEKAYVLSRGFVRRALENAPGDLHQELEWMFYEHGRLQNVIEDAKKLIEASGSSSGGGPDMSRTIPGWEDKAVPKLTPGGILPLQRTLGKLELILAGRKHLLSQPS